MDSIKPKMKKDDEQSSAPTAVGKELIEETMELIKDKIPEELIWDIDNKPCWCSGEDLFSYIEEGLQEGFNKALTSATKQIEELEGHLEVVRENLTERELEVQRLLEGNDAELKSQLQTKDKQIEDSRKEYLELKEEKEELEDDMTEQLRASKKEIEVLVKRNKEQAKYILDVAILEKEIKELKKELTDTIKISDIQIPTPKT